ncbi:MAG TPA: alkaline phosphatase family protein [Acidimicrobiales bacterium]
MTSRRVGTALVLLTLGATACSSVRSATSTSTPTTTVHPPSTTTTLSTTTLPTTATTRPSPPHVMVVMMENKGLTQVIGQSDQPFTNSLATRNGLATQSYAFGHPSLPNYLDIVSGSNQGVTDDNPPSSHRFPATATLADQLAAAGYSAKAYAENLPPDPTTSAGNYAVRHVPWEYFPSAKISVVDASLLLSDLDGAHAPDFVWYTPNVIDDEHNGTVEQGDAFLSRLIPSVQSTPWYRSGGQIIVEWDESDADNAGISGGDGGHIPTIVVSKALQAHPRQDPIPVDTAGILRSIEDAYGLAHLGAAANAANGSIDTLLSTAAHP